MSQNHLPRKEAINQLYSTIKTKFEQDGVLQEVRCMLHAKMVAMMKGKNESSTLVKRPPTLSITGGESCIMLLHQLIMEYLHWHGFHYTAEMFSQETACENVKPMRQCMEGVLGNFEDKDVPILLQLVAEFMGKQNQK